MARFLGLGVGTGTVALGSYTIIKAAAGGTQGTKTLNATGSFSPGDRIFIAQMRGSDVGVHEDNQVESYAAGVITLVHELENDYVSSGADKAQVVVVPDAAEYTGTLAVPGWDGDSGGLAVLACSADFGAIVNANGKGYQGSAGSTDSWGGNPQSAPLNYGNYAEGTAGAGGTRSNNLANGNGAGASSNGTDVLHKCAGSGGSYAGGALAGGEFTSNGSSGDIGDVVGDATLSAGIFMGGGGAGGRGHKSGQTYGNGGNGGGIIIIYAYGLTTDAELYANGAAGTVGSDDCGGGGGAGGTILLKLVNCSIGTNKITAIGGNGGSAGVAGGKGASGRIRIEACSIDGTTNPTASEDEGGQTYCGSILQII